MASSCDNSVIWLDGKPIKKTNNCLNKLYVDVICNQQVISVIVRDYLLSRIEHTPDSVAEMIHSNISIFDKTMLGELCASDDSYHTAIADAIISRFDFSNISICKALRVLFKHMTAPGEGQKFGVLMTRFSQSYFSQHPSEFRNSDSVIVLSYVLVMSYDVFRCGSHHGRELSEVDFIRNFRHADDGQDFPVSMLQQLYHEMYEEDGVEDDARREIASTKDLKRCIIS
jgi:Sec7-like guanine-nucleotide exchange factor